MTKPEHAYIGREDDFQRTAIGLVRMIARSAGIDPALVVHAPNGGSRHKAEAAKLKGMGVVAGYPDIMIFAQQTVPPINRRNYVKPRCGLALELKVWPKKPTKDQERIHDLLREQGWRVLVCYSTDEVEAAVREYLEPTNEQQ